MMRYKRFRLGEVATIRGGKRLPAGEDFITQKTAHPYIRARDIGGGKVEIHDPVFLNEGTARRLSRYTVNKGDVCLTIVGANVGEMGAVPAHLDGANLTENAVKIVTNGKADQTFLKYALLSDDALAQMKVLAGGAAQPKLGIYKVETIEFPCPSLPVQRKIGAVLSAYDELIENNTRRIKLLEQMAQALYREWFVRHCQAGKLSKGWEEKGFCELLDSTLGGDWGSEESTNDDNCPVAIIRGTDMDDVRTGSALRTPRRFIPASSLSKRKLREGDLVVENSVNAKTRCTGSTLLVTDGVLRAIRGDVIAASFCKVFRFKEPKFAPLAHLHMRHLHSEGKMGFYQNVAANGIGNFQSQRFVASEKLVIPKDEQRLSDMLGVLRDLTATTYAEMIWNLRRTRDLLLPKLISGEVDVSALDIETGEQAA